MNNIRYPGRLTLYPGVAVLLAAILAEFGRYAFTSWLNTKKRAGIPTECPFHDLRHTAVSRMVMKGIDPVTIGRLAVWTDSSAPVMLRRYAHLTGDHLRQAARALESNRFQHKLSTNPITVDIQRYTGDNTTPRNHVESARSSAG